MSAPVAMLPVSDLTPPITLVDSQRVMSISGHKTRSIFDRYNITDTKDVKEAMQAVVRYNTSLMQVAVASKS